MDPLAFFASFLMEKHNEAKNNATNLHGNNVLEFMSHLGEKKFKNKVVGANDSYLTKKYAQTLSTLRDKINQNKSFQNL